MTPAKHNLLILFPAYNEAGRIEPVLRDYAAYFSRNFPGAFELVAVLNGCTDNTLEVVEGVKRDCACLRHLEFPGRIGKGGALIEGLKLAPEADWIGYVDADGATAPAAFHDLVGQLESVDCVIGSRWIPGAVIHQSQTSRRQFASRIFNFLVRRMFGMPYVDTQCGAKVMKRHAAEAIHETLQIADMAFDINLLYSLKLHGFQVKEVPTEWTDKIGSKVQLGRTSLVMLLSAIRLRLVYSPFYKWLSPFRRLETWIYLKLSAPPPLPASRGGAMPGKGGANKIR